MTIIIKVCLTNTFCQKNWSVEESVIQHSSYRGDESTLRSEKQHGREQPWKGVSHPSPVHAGAVTQVQGWMGEQRADRRVVLMPVYVSL